MKIAGCNEPIGTYKLFISDFYIDDLRSGQSLDLPIISQWGKNIVPHFSQMSVVRATSIMDDISRDHPKLSFPEGIRTNLRPDKSSSIDFFFFENCLIGVSQG